jgi:hypothetical protein
MNITDVRAIPLFVPLNRAVGAPISLPYAEHLAPVVFGGYRATIVQVLTDEGLIGIGECRTRLAPKAVQAIVEELAPVLHLTVESHVRVTLNCGAGGWRAQVHRPGAGSPGGEGPSAWSRAAGSPPSTGGGPPPDDAGGGTRGGPAGLPPVRQALAPLPLAPGVHQQRAHVHTPEGDPAGRGCQADGGHGGRRRRPLHAQRYGGLPWRGAQEGRRGERLGGQPIGGQPNPALARGAPLARFAGLLALPEHAPAVALGP